MKKTPLFDARNVFFSILFLLAVIRGDEMLSGDSDLGRHLTLGEHILRTRSVPVTDILSHTLPQQSRPPYEWLTQVLFALANRLLGLDGVILFAAVIIAITFTLLFGQAVRRSGSVLLAFALTFLAAGAASIHWLPRPHLVTFLFITIWISLLEKVRLGRAVPLWRFLVLMLLWANMHGGFIFGFLAWGAYLAGWLLDWRRGLAPLEAWKPLARVGLAALPMTILTPDLWRNWEAVLSNRSAFILSRTVETLPPNFSYPATGPFIALALLSAILFVVFWKSVPAGHVFLLLGFGAMAALMARNIPLFTISTTPILCELASRKLAQYKAWKQVEERYQTLTHTTAPTLSILVVLAATGIFAYHLVATQTGIFGFNPQVFPVAASDWLETHPQSGLMFNEFNFGGYLLYRFNDKYPVFVDSQSDFYGEPLMREYVDIAKATGAWSAILEKYKVTWAIVPPNFELVNALQAAGWQTLYRDETAVILRQP